MATFCLLYYSWPQLSLYNTYSTCKCLAIILGICTFDWPLDLFWSPLLVICFWEYISKSSHFQLAWARHVQWRQVEVRSHDLYWWWGFHRLQWILATNMVLFTPQNQLHSFLWVLKCSFLVVTYCLQLESQFRFELSIYFLGACAVSSGHVTFNLFSMVGFGR